MSADKTMASARGHSPRVDPDSDGQFEAEPSTRQGRRSSESTSHRGHRAELRASQRGHSRPMNPPSAHGRNLRDSNGWSEPGFGPADNPNTPYHQYMTSARQRPASFDEDLERGLGTGASQEPYRPRSRGSTKPLTHGNGRDYRANSSPERPIMLRTFTEQLRSSGQKPDMSFGDLSKKEKLEMVRLPWYYMMQTMLKNHLVAALGEFVGTTMFLFMAFTGVGVAKIPAGTNLKNPDNNAIGSTFDISVQTYIALSFGFSLMVNVWVFYRISGGLFNPAVTAAFVLTRVITPLRAVFVFTAQAAGGIAAAGLVAVLFPTPLDVSTSLAPGVSLTQGVFIEALLTFELVFTILMLAAEKHRARSLAPVGIGLALFVAELGGVYYTGGSLNPARSLGPDVIAVKFESEHWIYWVGPLMGSLIAVVFYKVIKLFHYEEANPGQDAQD